MAGCLRVRGARRCVRVDPDVLERARAHSWHLHQGYPATTRGSGRAAQKLYLHRFATDGARACPVVDHRNGDKLDNRRENLRCASKAENTANIGRIATNTTGLKGVVARGRKFRAFIHKGGKTRHLGTFDTAKAAACAYDRAARQLFGKFAKTNGVRCGQPESIRRPR